MSVAWRWRRELRARPSPPSVSWTAPSSPGLASSTAPQLTLLTQLRTTQNLEIMFQTSRQLHFTEPLRYTEHFLLEQNNYLLLTDFSTHVSGDFKPFLVIKQEVL